MSVSGFILGIFQKIHQGIDLAEHEVQGGLNLIAAEAPKVTATLATVAEVAAVVSTFVPLSPGVSNSLKIATAAAEGLNAFAGSISTGGLANDITALLNGFIAYQEAKKANAHAATEVAAHAHSVLSVQ